MSEPIFNTAKAATYLGISKKTLLKYCKQHHITFMRYPGDEHRFRQSALDLFMGRNTIMKKAA